MIRKPCLLITRPMPVPVLAAAREICEVVVRADNSYLDAGSLAQALADHDVILSTFGDNISAQVFDAVPDIRCRLITNFGVGYNHIDVVAARLRDVAVTNTPGPVTDATADIALALMLMVARRTGEGERLLRAGLWDGWHPTQMMGMHLGGKTLGVIGMGRIGQAVARRAHFGFGMNVVFYNRSVVKDVSVPKARQVNSLTELMAVSDMVSVNIPGGGANRHFISAEILAAAKPGSYLVNTARGDVIDEAALIAALKSGILAGVGLDVYENEPAVPAALLAMENVVLLPHMGTNALEVRTQIGLVAVANIRAFVEGKQPPNLV